MRFVIVAGHPANEQVQIFGIHLVGVRRHVILRSVELVGTWIADKGFQPFRRSVLGKIRIPINEDRGETGQIVNYLKKYNGEGIQHIAVGARDIYDATDAISRNGIQFMPGPPDTYYDLSKSRVQGHDEPLDQMKKHGILIDGEGVVDGGETRILLQIFSKTVIGPIFFEFIQRKGDDGFGEGNFKALFESIEAEEIARGDYAAE